MTRNYFTFYVAYKKSIRVKSAITSATIIVEVENKDTSL